MEFSDRASYFWGHLVIGVKGRGQGLEIGAQGYGFGGQAGRLNPILQHEKPLVCVFFKMEFCASRGNQGFLRERSRKPKPEAQQWIHGLETSWFGGPFPCSLLG